MNNDPAKNLKDVSENEFKERLKEYSKKIEKKGKVTLPNEPVGSINIPKMTDEF